MFLDLFALAQLKKRLTTTGKVSHREWEETFTDVDRRVVELQKKVSGTICLKKPKTSSKSGHMPGGFDKRERGKGNPNISCFSPRFFFFFFFVSFALSGKINRWAVYPPDRLIRRWQRSGLFTIHDGGGASARHGGSLPPWCDLYEAKLKEDGITVSEKRRERKRKKTKIKKAVHRVGPRVKQI